MPLLALGLVGTAGGLIVGNQAKQKAKGLTAEAGRAAQVDIDALNERVKAISRQNALDSDALEKSLTPEISSFRTNSMNNLANGALDPRLQGVYDSAQSQQGQNITPQQVGQARSPLLQDAIARARADLGLGNKLDIETQNLVTRNGLANAGVVGGGGLGLGRDVVARDLGLTGLEVGQRRLTNAATLGQAELGMNQFNAGIDQFNSQAGTNAQFMNADNKLKLIQLLSQIQGQGFGQNLQAAAFGQSIAKPIVGLDPSAVANIQIGNQNAASGALTNQANIYGAQSQGYQKLAGQFGGLAALGASSGGGKNVWDVYGTGRVG